ncbi:MAG: hypothetical protein EBX41_01975 [Chitinophagia bacterium]|nr:hypothetical protein [Chitinophagia bacterium]
MADDIAQWWQDTKGNTGADDSGNTPVDNGNGGNGSIWSTIADNGGEYLTGLASIVAAFKGNPVNSGGGNNGGGSPPPNNTDNKKVLIMVGIGILVLVVIAIIIKALKK